MRKDSAGNFWNKKDHEHFYHTQQQLFTVKRKYCDFVVCAFDGCGTTNFFHQQILPKEQHWNLSKVTNFWRTCILPEVLGKWYTSTSWLKSKLINNQKQVAIAIEERTLMKKVSFVVIPNIPLFIFIYHVSRLKAFQKLGTASIAET